MEERIVVENHSHRRVEVELGLELAADFADIFVVKSLEPGFGEPADETLPPSTRRSAARRRVAGLLGRRVLRPNRRPSVGGVRRGGRSRSVRALARAGCPLAARRRCAGGARRSRAAAGCVVRARARRRAAPRRAVHDGVAALGSRAERGLGRPRPHVEPVARRSRGAADARDRIRRRALARRRHAMVHDRLRTGHAHLVAPDAAPRPRAGSGHPAGPRGDAGDERRPRARCRAREDHPRAAARQGGALLDRPLLRDRRRDAALPRPSLGALALDRRSDAPLELEDAARRALAWIDGPADADGDGLVEYERRSSHGIGNQTWKDSEDSMAFRDGTLALPPIAPVEVQGYVYDAKLRIAEIAREIWRDDALGREARARRGGAATSLRRGVLAGGSGVLRARPRPREASNRLPDVQPRASAVERHRPGAAEGGDRRLAHERSPLVGLGRADDGGRRGRVQPARLPRRDGLAARLLPRSHGASRKAGARRMPPASFTPWSRLRPTSTTACRRSSRALPRDHTGFPVVYPTASSPQAWAAGTPVLLLQAVLRLVPDRAERVLRSEASCVPERLEGLSLTGVHAFGRRWTVRVDAGAVTVEPTSANR